MREVLEDLKYLNRLNMSEFWVLLFPLSEHYYVEDKWFQFTNNMIGFLWGCSDDKIELLEGYIASCKQGLD